MKLHITTTAKNIRIASINNWIRPVVANLGVAGLLALACANATAQQVGTPELGTFEAFLKKQMPELAVKTPLNQPKIILFSVDGLTAITREADKITGLVVPKSPFPKAMENLPESDPRTKEYRKQLEEFFERRERVLQVRKQYNHLFNEKRNLFFNMHLSIPTDYFAKSVAAWNGDIFWAPASKETDRNLTAGDEARAVFGSIPPFDLTTLGKRTFPDGAEMITGELFVEVDGNRVELKPNPNKPGSPLEFEHKNELGNIVKWTTSIEKCDKPSLAGGITPCGTASRVSRWVKGNVEWIALARKTKDVEPLTADPYWQHTNPYFSLIGYIGFNRASGEVVFFDGSYPTTSDKFNWKSPIIQPGGSGYMDEQGRAVASRMYDDTFSINCAACHDNKEPRNITPYIKQARVGYRDPNGAKAKAFSLGELLPELTRKKPTAPYRVVGSGFTAVNSSAIKEARAIVDPNPDPNLSCTQCHGLTSNRSGTAKFASDAVGKLGSILNDEGKVDDVENSFRTDWALRSGAGQIHPWMIPSDGNDLSAVPPAAPIADGDWANLKAVLEKPNDDPRSRPSFTEAPAPESSVTDTTRIGDPSIPGNFILSVAANRDGAAAGTPKEITLSWNYLNDFGFSGTPSPRDDVRFNVALAEIDIPVDGVSSSLDQYPSIEVTKATGAALVAGNVYRSGEILILTDTSFAGHTRWTDPLPTLNARQYAVSFPANINKRYLIRVLAKRFCFDQSVEKFSSVDHVFSVDVK